jgi:hypothetical protein
LRALLFGRFWRCDLGLGFLLRLGLFKIFDGEFELLDQELAAFGGLPELFAPCLGQHQLQPLDFQPTRVTQDGARRMRTINQACVASVMQRNGWARRPRSAHSVPSRLQLGSVARSAIWQELCGHSRSRR